LIASEPGASVVRAARAVAPTVPSKVVVPAVLTVSEWAFAAEPVTGALNQTLPAVPPLFSRARVR
jgi:hypothetical protein